MAYHEALWVTFTAATPVLALTYVTSLGRAARMDHDAITLGIWTDEVKVARLFIVAFLGMFICAINFIWGLLALAMLDDLGPLMLPLSLMVLAFLLLFLLTILEMRSRTLLNAQQVLGRVFEKNPYLPDNLRGSVRAAENNNQVYWAIEDAPQVIRAIAAAGHVVQRVYIREDFFDELINIPALTDDAKPIDAISQAVIDAVIEAGNKMSTPDAVIRIVWT